jgi:hypothetical protein
MRTIALIPRSIILVAFLVTFSLLGQAGGALAVTSTITPSPSGVYIVKGAWYASGVTLSQDVQADPLETSILVNDKSRLRVGWVVSLGTEYVLIDQLVEGGVGHPDTMVVERGVNGSVVSFHPTGSAVKTQTVTFSIYVNNITASTGLGGFQIGVTLPPDVEFVQMTPYTTWLESTGRTSIGCQGPFQYGDTWSVNCATIGSTDGPKNGPGLVAKVTLRPSQTLGLTEIRLDHSMLVDIAGNEFPFTAQSAYISVLGCPDANLDGFVDSGDQLAVLRNFGDRGEDAGASLLNQLNATQTTAIVSDETPFAVGDTISIDIEQMTVTGVHSGSPDTINITRGVNGTTASSHSIGREIFKATYDGNRDGKKGYTGPMDVNHDSYLDSGDMLVLGSTAATLLHGECPAP